MAFKSLHCSPCKPCQINLRYQTWHINQLIKIAKRPFFAFQGQLLLQGVFQQFCQNRLIRIITSIVSFSYLSRYWLKTTKKATHISPFKLSDNFYPKETFVFLIIKIISSLKVFSPIYYSFHIIGLKLQKNVIFFFTFQG